MPDARPEVTHIPLNQAPVEPTGDIHLSDRRDQNFPNQIAENVTKSGIPYTAAEAQPAKLTNPVVAMVQPGEVKPIGPIVDPKTLPVEYTNTEVPAILGGQAMGHLLDFQTYRTTKGSKVTSVAIEKQNKLNTLKEQNKLEQAA